MVFLAGVGAEDENGPRGTIRHHNDLVAQCEYAFDKIKRVLGFEPKHTVQDAVRDLCAAFKAGKLPDSMDNDKYFNVKRMHRVWQDVYKTASASGFDPTKGHLSEIDVMHR